MKSRPATGQAFPGLKFPVLKPEFCFSKTKKKGQFMILKSEIRTRPENHVFSEMSNTVKQMNSKKLSRII